MRRAIVLRACPPEFPENFLGSGPHLNIQKKSRKSECGNAAAPYRAADGAAADGSGGVPNGGDATASATDTTTAANNLIPWGEARLVSAGLRGTDAISVLIDGGNVLEEPGHSDLLDIGPLALTDIGW